MAESTVAKATAEDLSWSSSANKRRAKTNLFWPGSRVGAWDAPNFPGVYTKVAHYENWIHAKINAHRKSNFLDVVEFL